MINLLNFLSLRGFLSKLSDNRVNILQVYLSLHETVSSFLVFFYRWCCSGNLLFLSDDLFVESAGKWILLLGSFWKGKAILVVEVQKTFQTKDWEVRFNQHSVMRAPQT